jgi:hypothetical protein
MLGIKPDVTVIKQIERDEALKKGAAERKSGVLSKPAAAAPDASQR